MTLNDFLGTLKIEANDVENIGKRGFIEGISHLIIQGLENIDIRERPIHCTDIDKSLMYVHDDNIWVEDSNQTIMNNAINQTGKKNLQALHQLSQKTDVDETYWDILGESLTENTSEKEKKNSAVIKKIAEHTHLTKDKIDEIN